MTTKDRLFLLVGTLALAAVVVWAVLALFEAAPDGNVAPTSSPGSDSKPVARQETPLPPASGSREVVRPDRTTVEPDVPAGTTPRNPPEGPVGSIRGRVLAPGGVAVAGAGIELMRGSTILINVPGAQEDTGILATSDEDGHFVLEDVEVGNKYILRASHPDYAPGAAGPCEVRAGEETVLAPMVLKRALRIYGHVRSKAGQPIPGAMVSVQDRTVVIGQKVEPKPPWKTVLTDGQGSYEFRGTTFKNFSVTSSAEGFASQTRMNNTIFDVSKEREVDFELGPAFSISGWVKNSEGSAVAGVKVSANLMRSEFSSEDTKTTDGSGHFQLERLEEGNYIVYAEKDGYSAERKSNVAAGATDVALTLRIQGTIEGLVLSALDGKPIRDFSITVKKHREGKPPVNTNITKKVSSVDGHFSLGGLEPDIYKVFVAAPRFAVGESEPIQVSRGEVIPGVRVLLDKGGTIVGRVLGPNRRPIAGAVIRLNENNYVSNPIIDAFSNMIKDITRPKRGARSAADGTFKLGLLGAGTFQVAVSHPEFADARMNDIVVGRSETTSIGDIVLYAGGTIQGVAYDADGAPLSGATVSAMLTADGRQGFMKTGRADESGLFVIKCLQPGTYQVTINNWDDKSNEPMHELVKMALATTSKKIIDVLDGQVVRIDLHLTKRTRGG